MKWKKTGESQSIDLLIDYLIKGSADDPDAEWKAAIALGNAQSHEQKQRAVIALLESLKSKRTHALTRAHVAEALGNLGDQRAVPALIKALNDEYQLVRSYAARALGKMKDSTAIEPLLHTLGYDPFFGARAEAAEALSNLCPEDKSTLCKKAQQALYIYREEEKKRLVRKDEEGRSRRVLAEIDRSLDVLDKVRKNE